MADKINASDSGSEVADSWHFGELDESIVKDECLHYLFEATADRYPKNTALVFGNSEITYNEFERKSNKLARYLRNNGVITGDTVGLLLKPSIELYISIIAIMKAGAAYVPIDTGAPGDRIDFISEDCSLKKLITSSALNTVITDKNKVIYIDKAVEEVDKCSGERLDHSEVSVKGTDVCYIIYTSGSTGRPKGVLTEHRNACNLVRAEQKIYKVVPEDRVYQGFTIAFDASVEELWMAFYNGAALIIPTQEMKQSGAELSKYLTKLGVTVFSTVSTLLSMLEEDIPTVRLLIQGGESCTEQIIKKWYKPGRRMFNTYGPTEATVIATYAECFPDEPVTIGKPLSNYCAYILDENMKETGVNEPGELCLGGRSIARGYLNREDLTSEKFIKNPFETDKFYSPRLYRTGDLAAFNEKGEIVFLGRIDTQVKIRGYRVELSEVEAVISLAEDVLTSIVNVHDIDGIQSLVAYILPKDLSKEIDTERIYRLLADKLPSYMIPSYYEIIDHVPTLPSGKTDRKNLPAPTGRKFKINRDIVLPKNRVEEEILSIWKDIFKTEEISTQDHFFNDLGGHSLIAALAASKMRENPEMNSIAVADIYANPTIEELSKIVIKSSAQKPDATRKKINKPEFKVSGLFHKVCGFCQGLSIYLYYLVVSLPFLALYLYGFFDNGFSHDLAVKLTVISIIMFLGYLPASLLLVAAIKWIVIGRYKEGDYPVWGVYFFRWWFVRLFMSIVPVQALTGTPLMSFYLRLMGAKVGRDCFIGTTHFGVFDLISIGDSSSIGFDSQLLGYVVEDGYLKIRKISIGNNCFIGPSSVISNSTVMKNNSKLGEQSMLQEGSVIPEGERWTGSPAVKSENSDEILDSMYGTAVRASRKRRFWFGFLCFLGQFPLDLIQVIATLPGAFLMLLAYDYIGIWALLTAPVIAISFNVFMCIEIAVIKRLLVGEIKPGHYKLYTSFYYKKWFVDQLMAISLSTMHCMYGTLYTAPFFRLLGCKIGKNVEVSTVSHISPDLLTIKDESFVADAGLIGTPKIYMGQINISETIIGSRTFIGNSALIPVNTVVGDNCLLGVLSIPPDQKKTPDGTSWLGSPAIFLHKRDINKDFSEEETFKPTKSMYMKRYTIEFIKMILPMTLDAIIIILLYYVLDVLTDNFEDGIVALLFPLFILGTEFITTGFIVLLKKILIGTYKPRKEPLWSTYVWRSELVTGVYESVTVPGFLSLLAGTPFIRFVLKPFGVKIGKRTFMDTTDITEFDLVEIEEEACINQSTLQTHLFEDRVMKMSHIKIRKRCNIGIGSFVLYDTEMEEHASIGNQSLLMKGETLLPDTEWEGIPVRRKE